MTGEPHSAASPADATARALEHAREHLERLGYRLLEEHRDRRTGARLLVARGHLRRELVFCELRAQRLGQPECRGVDLRRKRLRRAALAWLAANTAVEADTLRFERLTVCVGHDGLPVGLEHEPQAF
jgi:Holliday junction resolvase-like predicted endonuclease